MAPMHKKQRLYMEECCKRILLEKDIVGIIVVGLDGNPIKSTLADEQLSLQYCGQFGQLLNRSRSIINSLEKHDEVIFLRVRTKKHEVIISPDNDFIFMIIQNPTGH